MVKDKNGEKIIIEDCFLCGKVVVLRQAGKRLWVWKGQCEDPDCGLIIEQTIK